MHPTVFSLHWPVWLCQWDSILRSNTDEPTQHCLVEHNHVNKSTGLQRMATTCCCWCSHTGSLHTQTSSVVAQFRRAQTTLAKNLHSLQRRSVTCCVFVFPSECADMMFWPGANKSGFTRPSNVGPSQTISIVHILLTITSWWKFSHIVFVVTMRFALNVLREGLLATETHHSVLVTGRRRIASSDKNMNSNENTHWSHDFYQQSRLRTPNCSSACSRRSAQS